MFCSFLRKTESRESRCTLHLASGTASFRFQFIQRLLTGPKDLVWRPLTCAILKRLGGFRVDFSLFLMDLKTLDLLGLPNFYRGLLHCWNILQKERSEQPSTLYWLLKEPILHGSRLECVSALGQSVAKRFCSGKVTTFEHIYELTGPSLDNAAALTSHLGFRSSQSIK